MKKVFRALIPILALSTLFVSACTGVSAPVSASGGSKVEAAPVEFTGVIESINGNQWVINGQTITVDPTVVNDGPFNVGDTIKVEADVQADGSILVTRVESPSAAVVASEPPVVDVSSTPDPSSGSATADPTTGGGLVFDNSGSEAFGTVDSITTDTVVIGEQTFTISNGAEFKNQIQAGDFVKVHFTLNADGTMSITEIQTWDPAQVNGDNSNSNSNTGTSLDDNGNNNNDDNGGESENEDNSNSGGGDDSSESSGGNGS